MRNANLADDYIVRAGKRFKALQVLFDEEAWPDVVREAQELVELALKALLRKSNIEIPRIHDVSNILTDQVDQLPKSVRSHVPKLAGISHNLRRDRELAFYGTEDLTPSEFYSKANAKEALNTAEWVLKTVEKVFETS